MNKALGTAIVVLILFGIGAYFFFQKSETPTPPANQTATSTIENETESETNNATTVIGKSVENRDIIAYHFGEGEKELLFIGGIHGGYSWNTALVAYDLVDHLKANPSAVPSSVKVTVIPVLNPDGLNKIVGTTTRFSLAQVPASESATIPGRFNANEVDLNRNFDCDWQSTGTWQARTVSGGSAAFSEPESKAIRSYVEANKPTAAVVWYSSAGGVFASNCHGGVLPETRAILSAYSEASGYKASEDFDFYAITGDMVNWFAKEGIPAISVLLTNHRDTEWEKNQKGIEALLQRYAQ
jgi:hypothetical protein